MKNDFHPVGGPGYGFGVANVSLDPLDERLLFDAVEVFPAPG